MIIKRSALTLLLWFATVAFAEDPAAKEARDELEKQLHQMVAKQPTKVRVDFIGLDDPNYKIEEAAFELDGRMLITPPLTQLADDGAHLVWNGDVTPGKHTVKVLLVFSNGASVVLSDEGGYKWKIGGDVSFEVNSGIEVRVQVTPKRDGKQSDVAKRFKLALPAQPVMIAELDDGKMPDPMARRVIAIVDAGVAGPSAAALLAEAKRQKAAEAAEAKRLAADAKKEKAAAALEERRAVAEAKKAKLAEALEAKRLAAEERKRAADAKKQAAQEAADEKRGLAQAALDAKNPTLAVVTPQDAGTAAVVAVAEPVEVIDAGAAVAVAIAVVDAGVSAPLAAAPAAEGPPWLMIGIAGGVVGLIFLIIIARRRSRPPTLGD